MRRRGGQWIARGAGAWLLAAAATLAVLPIWAALAPVDEAGSVVARVDRPCPSPRPPRDPPRCGHAETPTPQPEATPPATPEPTEDPMPTLPPGIVVTPAPTPFPAPALPPAPTPRPTPEPAPGPTHEPTPQPAATPLVVVVVPPEPVATPQVVAVVPPAPPATPHVVAVVPPAPPPTQPVVAAPPEPPKTPPEDAGLAPVLPRLEPTPSGPLGAILSSAEEHLSTVVKPNAAIAVAESFSFPLLLMLAVFGYVAVQGLIDARDPKLRLAPERAFESIVPFRIEIDL